MKTLIRLMLVLLFAQLASSCVSTRISQSRRLAASGPDGLRQLVSIGQEQVAVTTTSLVALTAFPDANLPETRAALIKEVERMNAVSDQLTDIATAMRKQGKGFFDTWYSSAPDKTARNLRKAAVNDANPAILEKMTEVNSSLGRFVGDLREIRQHLDRHSGTAGIDPIRAVAARAAMGSNKLLDDLQSLNALLLSLSPVWQISTGS